LGREILLLPPLRGKAGMGGRIDREHVRIKKQLLAIREVMGEISDDFIIQIFERERWTHV
jgi:hypothetical protein